MDYLRVDKVPAEKIYVGIPLYGHAWYNTGLTGNTWKKFGNPSMVQGLCCGPFQQTNGAQPGKGSSQCGTMMWSEIQAAQPDQYYYDNHTRSAIGYFTKQGADGYTAAGTWLTYNDVVRDAVLSNMMPAMRN
jgi:hypothetical protein